MKGTYKKIKPLSINGKNCRIIHTERVIHIEDEAGETVLMTTNNQNLVYGLRYRNVDEKSQRGSPLARSNNPSLVYSR